MNIKILLLSVATVSIVGCSTAYKSGQTPDDVYFSPIRAVEEKQERNDEAEKNYQSDNYEDRAIRMSTRDRRWRDLDDDYDYNGTYNPYRYGYNHGYYYNPYYYNRPVFLPGNVIVNPKNSTPRMTNLGSYTNSTLVVSDPKSGQTKWVKSNKSYNNSNNNGTFIRRILTPVISSPQGSYPGRSGSTERSSNNTRTYSPSNNNSSSGSSSSGSSGSGRSVTRPPRGN